MPNGSILVLGAGELGTAVLWGLANHASRSESPISVLLRPSSINSTESSKKSEIDAFRATGINLVPADLVNDSVETLSSIFKRFDTVIGCTGFVAGRNIQLKLAQAALAAGVSRYFPWQFGVDYDVIGRGSAQDLFDEQLDVRDLLRSQDRVEWVIISTGMFTSFLFEPYFGVVDLENDVVRALGSWKNSVTVTTAQDIGALTAEVVFAEPRIANTVVYTAGDTVTYERVADLADSLVGRKLHREEWDVPQLEQELERDPDNPIKKYRVVFAQGKGVSWGKGRTFNGKRGLKVMDIDEWAAEHLKTNTSR
ncbi:hypothetical protein EC968_000802 [Mortierella alpina]|nr:hypothetical protein EC968_000802 [Mortierella alpina]